MTITLLRRVCALILIALSVTIATEVNASGYIANQETRQRFSTYDACQNHLHSISAQHIASVRPKVMTPDKGFRGVSLQDISGGVNILRKRYAVYRAKLWYHNGSLMPGGTQYEVNHSWSETNLECRGKILVSQDAQGYTLSTFEPVTPNAP